MPTIREAAQVLAGLDQDHATEQNGVGFAGSTQFVHDLLGYPRWTIAQQNKVKDALRLHKKQLAGLGFDYENLVEEPTTDVALAGFGVVDHKPSNIDGDLTGGRFTFQFKFSNEVKEALKAAIPGRVWEGDLSMWTAPTTSFREVVQFAGERGFQLTERAATIAKEWEGRSVPAPARMPTPPSKFVMVQNDEFVIGFPFDAAIKDDLKANVPGRRFDPDRKVWTAPLTSETEVRIFAAQHDFVLGPSVKALPEKKQTMLKLSKATDSNFMQDYRSKSGFALRPYQRAGSEHLVKNEKTYLADEMRLGKTVCVMGATQHITEMQKRILRVLVICPSSVVPVWERHVAEWLPDYPAVRKAPNLPQPQAQGFYVTSFQRAQTNREALKAVHWDIIVVDEAHKLKNRDAKRTQAILGVGDRRDGSWKPGIVEGVRYRWFLTGTAVEKKPAELIQPLIGLDRLKDVGGFVGFATRYCGWVKGVPGSIQGCVKALLPELNERLRTSGSWLRREMKDVYEQMPVKTYIRVPLEMTKSGSRAYQSAIRETISKKQRGEVSGAEAVTELTAVRRITAEAKTPAAIEWVEEFLDDTENKLVLLGWHTAPLQAIHEAFKDRAVILTGASSMKQRMDAMDRFQTDSSVRLFVGNILAAGEGINLSAASDVAVFELPWNASTLDQGIARILQPGVTTRMGIHFLLAEGTIDEDMAEMVDEKRKISAGIHDGVVIGDDDASMVSRLFDKLLGRVDEEGGPDERELAMDAKMQERLDEAHGGFF